MLIEFSYLKNRTFFIVDHVEAALRLSWMPCMYSTCKTISALVEVGMTLPQLPSYQILFLSTERVISVSVGVVEAIN